jgi:Fe-S oxidoreductase
MAMQPKPNVNLNDFLFRTTDGSAWQVPDAATFDFAGFFDWMTDARHLLLHKSEMTWMEKQEVPDHPVDVFMNISCGTQLAPHLTLDIVGVLRALGVSFIAGSGRQFCCGKIYRSRGRVDAGEKMSEAGVTRFTSWGAKSAVHSCHSCQIIYTDYVGRVDGDDPRLENFHLTTFIEQRLRELGDRVPWQRPIRRRVLLEGHGPELSAVHHEATESAGRILAMIPGVEVVGPVKPPSRGAPCKTRVPGGPSVLAELTMHERREVVAEIEAQAAAVGADTISANAHYCHREWCKFSSEKVAVSYYASILAEALGCANPDRYQEYWKLYDSERVLQLTRPNWESWGLAEDEARLVAKKHFDSHQAGFVNPQCACNGDPGKCTTGKYTLDVGQAPGVASYDH